MKIANATPNCAYRNYKCQHIWNHAINLTVHTQTPAHSHIAGESERGTFVERFSAARLRVRVCERISECLNICVYVCWGFNLDANLIWWTSNSTSRTKIQLGSATAAELFTNLSTLFRFPKQTYLPHAAVFYGIIPLIKYIQSEASLTDLLPQSTHTHKQAKQRNAIGNDVHAIELSVI